MGQRIVVYNQKGGGGKSTTADALATYFSGKGLSVVVIDLDGQATLSRIMMRGDFDNNAPGMFEVLNGTAKFADILYESRPRLWIAPASTRLFSWQYNEEGVAALRHILEGSRDVVFIIDCSPAWTDLSKTAMAAGTCLIAPCQPTPNDVLGLRGLYDLVQGIRGGMGMGKMRVVVTRYQSRTNLHRNVVELLRRASPFEVCKTVISESVAVQEAADDGQSIITYRPSHKVAREYVALGREVETWLSA